MENAGAPPRGEYDGPARTFVVVLGLILIAASVPFVIALLPATSAFNVSWSAADGQSATGPASADGSPATVSLPVSDTLTASLVITVPACNDVAGPGGAPALLSWRLERQGGQGEPLASDQLTCSQSGTYAHEVARIPQPAVGVQNGTGSGAAARDDARSSLWQFVGGLNETATYTLTTSWSRPSVAPVPVPLPPQTQSFAATLKLTERHWLAALNPVTPEVTR
ncbi:MAG: hypothetical protein ACYDBQ_07425 [Thermoplasmatota archaeon]